jgi:hypothetical protein
VAEREVAVPEQAGHVRDLPVGDRPVLLGADGVPVQERRARRHEHHPVLLGGSVVAVDQLPRLVEQAPGKLALCLVTQLSARHLFLAL